jgi:3-oxoadipate enol-lactonase
MPFLEDAQPRLHYRLDGRPGSPLLVLGNSLGTDISMWERQMEAFTAHHRVLRIDTRGHGASDVAPGEARIEDLARDVMRVVDALHVDRFAFCGLSLGAMVGQWLGIHMADRLDRLVLSNAAAYLPPPESWSQRMALARRDGMAALVDAVMPRFFSQDYRDRADPFFDSMRNTFLATSAEGYAVCCGAVRDADFRPDLHRIATPTLVIAGALDTATPADIHGVALRDGIAGAHWALLQAGHIANVEQPQAFNRAVMDFLRG